MLDMLSSTTAYCSWRELAEIDRNGIITEYEVQFTPLIDCAGIVGGARRSHGNSTQLVVTGLQEHTKYSFRVRAFTSAGPGPHGDAAVNVTSQDGMIMCCQCASLNLI